MNSGSINVSSVLRIYGTYERALWRNELTAYTLFLIRVGSEIKERNSYGCITCAASIPAYEPGIPLCVDGLWEQNSKGTIFRAQRVKEDARDNTAAIQYLSSGICQGIGPKLATLIVEAFGIHIFERAAKDILLHEEMCEKIPQLKKSIAIKLQETICRTVIQRTTFELIAKYGGNWTTAQKLFKKFGMEAYDRVKRLPYTAMDYGMTFEQCDAMAAAIGENPLGKDRTVAAVKHSINLIHSRGCTYAAAETVITQTDNTLARSRAFREARIPAALIAARIEECRFLVIEGGDNSVDIWHKRIKLAEDNAARQIARLQRTSMKLEFDPALVDAAQAECGIRYAPKQREAFSLLERSGIAVVTGGPGTGKTTTVNGIISAYEWMYPDNRIRLCAPTGRAAQRMSESTQREAVTIHRLLEYRPFGNTFACKNAEDPVLADLIVVDEASMLDTEVASLLFSAVKDGALVLLIGDVDQLPSVGPGNVLNDIIESGMVPVVRLDAVYRQKGGSPIIVNAAAINRGEDNLTTGNGFEVEYAGGENEILDEVAKWAQKFWDPEDPFGMQVLTPVHGGGAGERAINQKLQELFNPKQYGIKECRFGKTVFRTGDKVIMLSNNYACGYYNGDLGIIRDIIDSRLIVDIMGKEIELKSEMFMDISLAYAMTVHKSQGSEFKNVIISLPFSPRTMLKRNLFYTAVTRAKASVTIISENGALSLSTKTCDTGKRLTKLAKKIRAELGREGVL